MNNEAVLKALLRIKDNELTFAKAISVASETEDAARVAKETVHGSRDMKVHKFNRQKQCQPSSKISEKTNTASGRCHFPKGTCGRCGSTSHKGNDCPHIKDTCTHCQKTGHMERACLPKDKGIPKSAVKVIYTSSKTSTINTVKVVNTMPHHIME